jgi:hypothetical protein
MLKIVGVLLRLPGQTRLNIFFEESTEFVSTSPSRVSSQVTPTLCQPQTVANQLLVPNATTMYVQFRDISFSTRTQTRLLPPLLFLTRSTPTYNVDYRISAMTPLQNDFKLPLPIPSQG